MGNGSGQIGGALVGAVAGCMLALFALPARALSNKPSPSSLIGPPPAWADGIEADLGAAAPEGRVSGGIDYVLVDRQTRVGDTTRESFRHYAKKVVNDAGLAAAGDLSIDFEPSYQTLRLHFVRVRRNGQILDRLSSRKIQIIQRESELEYQLYDGTLSAVILLEDVRVGDVVEYAYTLRGANPVFEGLYFDWFSARWEVPVHRQRWRLLWPSARRLYVKNHSTSIEPVRRTRGSVTEYLWEERDVAPLVPDSDAPAWYDTASWVQLSEWSSWGEVADWAVRRFARASGKAPAVLRKVAEIRDAAATSEAGVLAALRFVQDDVRYLGIEIGESSHQPSPPETVLRRRFGDCKDKAGLFCAILEGLGVEAQPVLVNTDWHQGLESWQPSPTAFNHVVARVRAERSRVLARSHVVLARGSSGPRRVPRLWAGPRGSCGDP